MVKSFYRFIGFPFGLRGKLPRSLRKRVMRVIRVFETPHPSRSRYRYGRDTFSTAEKA